MLLSAEPLETIKYVIDAADTIRQVTPNWDAFALANAAPHLLAQDVVGTSIWDYITGMLVRNVYHDLLQHVRRHGRPIEFPFRCDAPGRRRFMQMRLMPDADGAITLLSATMHEEPRVAMTILSLPASGTGDALEICSFCKQAHLPDDTWAALEDAVIQLDLFGEAPAPSGVTHSVCPTCLPELKRRMGL